MISANVFNNRRKILLSNIDQLSAVLIFSEPELNNKNGSNKFHQNRDFLYFTGFDEPNALIILIKINDKNIKSIMFNRKKDLTAEIWFGNRLGQEDAIKKLTVDQAFPWELLNEKLYTLLNGLSIIYHALGESIINDNIVFNALKKLKNNAYKCIMPTTIKDWRPLVHNMRVFKEPEEIEIIRSACKISSLAHLRAMKICSPGMFEYQIEGEILHEFKIHGALYESYNTIVGSGENACILHYTKNQSKLKNGDLILIDAGCEFKHYSSDITRTFPINGIFNKYQRNVYNIVLSALKIALSLFRPGINFSIIHEKVITIIVTGLVNLGILKGDINKLIEEKKYRQFFMHGVSHWLGLDVHDVDYYGPSIQKSILQPGMVLTIEPGIYISQSANVPIEYKNIGVRIEDTILITKTGYENFTNSVIKEVYDIEHFIKSQKQSA
ncbi:MAG: Xaa-Pro aminopeptidase [Pantoea sp. Brub]|nr:Xaa-Pro aminopeptidase [Pantoea sp. Brub]